MEQFRGLKGAPARFLSAVALIAAFASPAAAQNRITGRADANETVRLKRHQHPGTIENDRGPVDPSLAISGITLSIKLSAAQQADLDQLLEEQRDPSSPAYRNWLTPEEFGARFGLNNSDMETLTAWLRSQGLKVDQVSRSMNWITFSGSAAQVDRAFHTELHGFLADGQFHFANTKQPEVPAAFGDVIADVQGLNDFRLKPGKLNTRRFSADYTTSGTTHNLAPGDIATIYDINPIYSAGFTGTGQKIVVAGQTDVSLSDIASFRSQFGLPANVPQLVLTGTDPGTVAADVEEAALDLEWTGAIAQNATIIYVYSTNVITSVQYAVSQNLAPVISLSYGGCEALNSSSLESIAQQANAQGITWLASTGDTGAAGCDSGTVATKGLAVQMPASIPEVTAVGGSELSEGSGSYWSTKNGTNGGSALSYIPEIAWNDSVARGDLAATGGGASKYYKKPTWQTGTGVPADGARDIPDVSLPASPDHDGYFFYSGGSLGVIGGTSVSTPAFAGIVSLLNQYLVSKGALVKAGLGNINPTLYHLAATTSSVFHDITSGSNIVACTAGSPNCVNGSLGYLAGVGYDQATGLGSIDAANMVTNWSSLASSISTTSTLTANPASIASTASTTLTATVKPATGTTAPTGTVTFSLGTTTLGTVTLVASGSSATATLVVSGNTLSIGSNTLTASYGGSLAFTSSSATASVTVTAAAVGTTTTVTANPASITTSSSTVLTATVKGTSGSKGPTGAVTFSLGSKTLGTGTLTASGSSATATLTVAASALATGSNTITASYAATTAFTASSGTTTVTVTVPAVGTTTTVSANPASISSGASTVLTATVKPASGTTAPTGTVTFSLGSKSLGTGTLTASGSTATATLTVSASVLATGSNTITASYAATTAFTASSGTTTVTVTASPVATTTTISASPTSISSTASTVLTATVKPASGSTAPTGVVTFTLGTKTLGTGTLTASGSTATASLTVAGSALATGSNTITAAYTATTAFTASSGTTNVTVTVAPIATTTTVTASLLSLTTTGSTVLTATVKPAGGSTAPTGTVTFTSGSTTLGTATLTASGSSATATLTVKGSQLVSGTNTVKAGYSGSTAFAASSGTLGISLTGSSKSSSGRTK